MSARIDRFEGDYAFLSNFALIQGGVLFEGARYPSVEHAFAAAKTLDPAGRELIRALPSAGAAKRAGRTVSLRPDWYEARLGVMEDLLRQKFAVEPFRAALAATGSATLIEGNNWGDRFWGVDGSGENHLGKLLMELRAELTR